MLFDSEFEIILANTKESKKLHYALRYQVYCQEMGYEDPSQFSDELEVDSYDASSIHFIARSKRTKEWIGAIRLIVGELSSLPAFHLSDPSFHQRRMQEELERSDSKVALEISRLCILGCYRKVGDSMSYGVTGKREVSSVTRRRQPEVLLGLMRTAYAYCSVKKIDVCLFTISRSLARIMNNLDLNIIQAGEEIDHRGLRAPYYTHIPNFLGNIHLKSPASYSMFVSQKPYRLYDPSLPEAIVPALANSMARLTL